MRESAEFEQWANKTYVHPLGLTALILAALFVLTCRRRWLLVAPIALACVCARQRVVLATLDFDFLRIIMIVCWLRVVMRGEVKGIHLRPMDWWVIVWVTLGTFVFCMQREFDSSHVIYRCGWAFDLVTMYCVSRVAIRDWEDLQFMARYICTLAIPVAILFAVEKSTGRNPFAIFGGLSPITYMREGRLRCQGAFSHAILAGCFWATQIPLCIALWRDGTPRGRQRAGIAGAACLFIVFACSSSTPLIAVGVSFVGFLFLPLRNVMGNVRAALVVILVALHLGMKKPVWHLIARIDMVGGSTGHHRYRLIDAAVNNFPDWYMLGTKSTAKWGPVLQDVTNQYILEGVRGGVWSMIAFIAVIVCGFRGVGRAVDRYAQEPRLMRFSWAIGVMLLAHTMAFIAVSYFGQIQLILFVHLAMVAGLDEVATFAPRPAPRPARRRNGPAPAAAPGPSGSAPRTSPGAGA